MSAALALPILPAITVDWDCAFQHRVTREAVSYWQSLRGDRDMPERTDLNPSSMRRFLQYVNLVELDPELPGYYIVRLQGAHTREVFGNLANRSWNEVFSGPEQDRWKYCFDLTRDSNRHVRLFTHVATQGQLWLDCEVLIAPLSNSDGKPPCYFWVFVSWLREPLP
jgi:hypothetical protein